MMRHAAVWTVRELRSSAEAMAKLSRRGFTIGVRCERLGKGLEICLAMSDRREYITGLGY